MDNYKYKNRYEYGYDFGVSNERLKYLLSAGLDDEKRKFWWDRLLFEARQVSGAQFELGEGIITANEMLTIKSGNDNFNGCYPLCVSQLLEEKVAENGLIRLSELLQDSKIQNQGLEIRRYNFRSTWDWKKKTSGVALLERINVFPNFPLLVFLFQRFVILFGYMLGFLLDKDGYYIELNWKPNLMEKKCKYPYGFWHNHELETAFVIVENLEKTCDDVIKALLIERRPKVQETCVCVDTCSHVCSYILCVLKGDSLVQPVHDMLSIENLQTIQLTAHEWEICLVWLVFKKSASTQCILDGHTMVKICAHSHVCGKPNNGISYFSHIPEFNDKRECQCMMINVHEISLVTLTILTGRAKTQLDKMMGKRNKLLMQAREHEQNKRPKTTAWCYNEARVVERGINKWNQQLDKTFLAQTQTEYMEQNKIDASACENHILKEIEVWTILLEESIDTDEINDSPD